MEKHTDHKNQYSYFALMIVLSFISMYIIMYAMVDVFGNVFLNFNQFYMVSLMIVPMVMIELILMREMYKNMKLNILIAVISMIIFVLSWIFIRQQIGISDKQFLKSMIPHHGGAILMCKEAKLKDPELKELCNNIIKGQQEEINQMKAKLDELEK